jgi:hypothetical protein
MENQTLREDISLNSNTYPQLVSDTYTQVRAFEKKGA